MMISTKQSNVPIRNISIKTSMLSVHLMEEVTRMTYNELFQFKKSLLETGQAVLANSVPVETVPPFEENIPCGKQWISEKMAMYPMLIILAFYYPTDVVFDRKRGLYKPGNIFFVCDCTTSYRSILLYVMMCPCSVAKKEIHLYNFK